MSRAYNSGQHSGWVGLAIQVGLGWVTWVGLGRFGFNNFLYGLGWVGFIKTQLDPIAAYDFKIAWADRAANLTANEMALSTEIVNKFL